MLWSNWQKSYLKLEGDSMAKIYYNCYMERVNKGEITLSEAILLAEQEVPVRWRKAVIELLEANV